MKHTCFIFNKLLYFFYMINVTIVQNENALRSRVEICKRNLVIMLDMFKHNKSKKKSAPLARKETLQNALS